MNETRVDCAALAAIYGEGARSYDELWSPVIRPPAESVIDSLDLGDATCVVDVGAGTGALLDALRAAAPRGLIVSVDPALQMLQYASQRRNAITVLADAAALPVATASVDVVLLAYVLFHLLDPRAGLNEAVRVLRTGGRVGTVTLARESSTRAAEIWTKALDELGVPTLPALAISPGSIRKRRSTCFSSGPAFTPLEFGAKESSTHSLPTASGTCARAAGAIGLALPYSTANLANRCSPRFAAA